MATHVLIVWPQAAEADRLYEAILRCGLGLRPKLIQEYPDRRRLAELLSEPDRPRAVVAGMTREETALQLLDDLKAAPDVLAVAAHREESSELMRAVMRTGAADFLTPPFLRADLQRTFRTIAARADERPEGSLLVVMPCRGNDGGSTVAVHLAQGLSASSGPPALLVDCDAQCGVTAFRLGLHTNYSLADALAHAEDLEELLNKIVVRWRDFDVIVSPDSSLGLMGDHLERLPQVLAVARRSYGAVIADMPPGMYSAGLEAMRAAANVYLVCTPDLTSLHLARRRVSELLANGIERGQLRVILNRSDSRRAVNRTDIERVIGMALFFELANDYGAVHRAAVAGALVDSDTELGRDLSALAGRIAGPAPAASAQEASGWKRILRLH